MERFDPNEIDAIRRSSLAVRSQDTNSIIDRLGQIYLQLGDLIYDHKSIAFSLDKLFKEVTSIEYKLKDTLTILGFMFRERKLMEKLAKVDRDSLKQEQIDEQENNDISVDEFIDKMFGNTMDDATRQRVEQLIEVNQLIESVTVNEEGEGHISNLEKIKSLLAKVKPKSMLRGYTRSFEPNSTDRDSRPYRDLNARGPAYKGESYVPPKTS